MTRAGIDLLGIMLPGEGGPIDGISLLPLIDGKMENRPKPIPFQDGNQTRLIDSAYTLANGRLFRFAEGGRKDVDITDQEPEVLRRMTDWMNAWKASVKKDAAAYTAKAPGKRAAE